MPGSPLSESRKWESITAPPADGDAVSVSSGAAPFRSSFMDKVAARDSYLYNGPFHGFHEEVRSAVIPSGSSRTWRLLRCGRIALERSDAPGTIDFFAPTGVDIDVSSIGSHYDPWFVYGLNTAGVFWVHVDTTPPASDGRFKTGDNTSVYLGSFLCDYSGNPIPQQQSGRSYWLAHKFTGFLPTLGPTSVGGVSNFAALAPVTAIVGRYRFSVVAGPGPASGGSRVGAIRPSGCARLAAHTYQITAERIIEETVSVPLFASSVDLEVESAIEVRAQAVLVGWEE